MGHRTLVGEVLPLCRDAVTVFYSPNRLVHRTLVGEVLPLCRDAVTVFYSPSRLNHWTLVGEGSYRAKTWTAIDRLSVIWNSDLTDKMKRSFFQAAVVSILLYGCTTWTLTKRMEKKLDGNYTRMLRAILNKSWKQHFTKQQLYGHLPPITKAIKIRYAGHCWKSRDKLISDVILWTPSHGRAKVGRPARTDIQHLCVDTGCSPVDLPEVMDDKEGWLERVRDIRVDGAT